MAVAMSDSISDSMVRDNESAGDDFQEPSDLQIWRTPDQRTATMTWQEHVVRTQSARRYHLIKTTQLIWLATTMLESLFAMRFVLKLVDANPSVGFAIFIYNLTAVFLAPFFGLTVTPSAGGAVFEIPTMIAMIVYAVWAWLIVRVVWIVFEEQVTT